MVKDGARAPCYKIQVSDSFSTFYFHLWKVIIKFFSNSLVKLRGYHMHDNKIVKMRQVRKTILVDVTETSNIFGSS